MKGPKLVPVSRQSTDEEIASYHATHAYYECFPARITVSRQWDSEARDLLDMTKEEVEEILFGKRGQTQ